MSDWTMDLIYKPDVAMIKKQLLLGEEGQRGLGGQGQATEKEESKKSGTSNSKEESHKEQQPRQKGN